MQAITTISLDIAKSVFRVHGVDADGNRAGAFAGGTHPLYRTNAQVVALLIRFVKNLLPKQHNDRQIGSGLRNGRYRLLCRRIKRVMATLSGERLHAICAERPLKNGPQNAAHVNISDDYEVRYWTTTLSVPNARLVEVVTKVGTSIIAVRQELAPL